jgi:hypothetical protein
MSSLAALLYRGLKMGNCFDYFATFFETFEDGENTNGGLSNFVYSIRDGVDGLIDFGQSVAELFKDKDQLDANNHGDRGKQYGRDQGNNLRKGH